MAYESIPLAYARSLFECLFFGSIRERLGFALMLLAVLAIATLLMAARSIRGPRFSLFLTAMLIATGGYIIFDLNYLTIELRMRQPEKVRADCEMLRRRNDDFGSGESEMDPQSAELPESIRRLGPTRITVTPDAVRILLHSDENGRAWGYLYDPSQFWVLHMPGVRPTLYRDLFAYEERAE